MPCNPQRPIAFILDTGGVVWGCVVWCDVVGGLMMISFSMVNPCVFPWERGLRNFFSTDIRESDLCGTFPVLTGKSSSEKWKMLMYIPSLVGPHKLRMESRL